MTGLLSPPKGKRKAPPLQQQLLEPEKNKWAWNAVILSVLGILVYGLALVASSPLAGILGCVVLQLASASVIYTGILSRRRAELMDKVVEAVGPLLGVRLDRSLVRASRWKGKGAGTPGRIRLRYVAGIDDTDAAWVGEIRAHLERRIGHPYAVAEHNRKQCVITFTPAEAEEQKESLPVEVRAEKVVKELLGSPTEPNPDVSTETAGGVLTGVVVHHGVGTRIARPVYRNQVERTFSTMLPGRWRATWDLELDTVRFELRPMLPDRIPHPIPTFVAVSAREGYSKLEIPYGVDEDGNVLVWIPSINPHLLISGTSGSGKTVTVQGIVAELALAGWQIRINDAKLIEFLGFRDWPNVELVAASTEEQVRLIHWACDLMEERYDAIVHRGARISDFEPVLLVLDEFADFRESVTDWYADIKQKGDPTKVAALKRVRSVARKGRTARVHFLVSLQRPDAEFLTGEVRDNFSARISMGRLSPNGALMMWENASIGVSLPRKSRGLGVTLNDNSQPVEFRSYWTPDPYKPEDHNEEDTQILEALRPKETKHPRMMILPPDGDIDDEGEEKEATYSEWATAPIVPYNEAQLAALRPKFTVVRGDGRTEGKETSRKAKAGLSIVSDVDPEETDDLDDEYGEAQSATPDQLIPGDLVLLDETLGLWGVVESAEEDILDEECMCIDYRTDDGEMESISYPADELITYRRSIDADKVTRK